MFPTHRFVPVVAGLLFLLVIAPAIACAADAGDVGLHPGVVVHFATKPEGQAALMRHDAFTRELSKFDLQIHLKTEKEASLEAVLKMMAGEVRPWTAKEQAKLTTIVALLGERLDRWKLPLPKTVLLVKTTGKEESGAAYCRANAIVLPQNMIDQNETGLQRLLTHELFHVLSNQNPKLRNKLYEIVGFHPCDPIQLPAGLKDRKITNPDAPLLEHVIKLEIDGQPVHAVALLYSATPYSRNRPGNLFSYMKFGLLVVEQKPGAATTHWEPVLSDGQPRILSPSPKALPSYFQQIGLNTGYIIHAEEVLADNFQLLVGPTSKKIRTPRILQQMDAVFKQHAKESSSKQKQERL